jgi:hypothetical protein
MGTLRKHNGNHAMILACTIVRLWITKYQETTRALTVYSTGGPSMDAIINWFRNLSRNAQIAILVAVAIFTPAVGILFRVFSKGIGAFFIVLGKGIAAAWNVLGFVLGFVNWGVASLLILVFVGYKFYAWINSEDETEEEDNNDYRNNPFL